MTTQKYITYRICQSIENANILKQNIRLTKSEKKESMYMKMSADEGRAVKYINIGGFKFRVPAFS